MDGASNSAQAASGDPFPDDCTGNRPGVAATASHCSAGQAAGLWGCINLRPNLGEAAAGQGRAVFHTLSLGAEGVQLGAQESTSPGRQCTSAHQLPPRPADTDPATRPGCPKRRRPLDSNPDSDPTLREQLEAALDLLAAAMPSGSAAAAAATAPAPDTLDGSPGQSPAAAIGAAGWRRASPDRRAATAAPCGLLPRPQPHQYPGLHPARQADTLARSSEGQPDHGGCVAAMALREAAGLAAEAGACPTASGAAACLLGARNNFDQRPVGGLEAVADPEDGDAAADMAAAAGFELQAPAVATAAAPPLAAAGAARDAYFMGVAELLTPPPPGPLVLRFREVPPAVVPRMARVVRLPLAMAGQPPLVVLTQPHQPGQSYPYLPLPPPPPPPDNVRMLYQPGEGCVLPAWDEEEDGATYNGVKGVATDAAAPWAYDRASA